MTTLIDSYIKATKQDKVSAYFLTRKYNFLNRYLKEVRIGELKIGLDIGSNNGLFTELMRRKGYLALGIDVEDRFIKFSRKMFPLADFTKSKIEDVNFKPNSLDLIFILDTLEHVIDREATLKKINNLLTPDGTAIIIVPNTMSYFYARSALTFVLRGWKIWKNVHYQQNYFHWEHLIGNYLKIKDVRPTLAIPFFEPKLISRDRLSDYEYDKTNLAWMSAEPIFICTKKTKEQKCNRDDNEDWR